MTHDHDALREAFTTLTSSLPESFSRTISDWWIAKLEAQSARNGDELESIAKEIEKRKRGNPEPSLDGDRYDRDNYFFNVGMQEAAAIVRARIGV